MTEVSDWRNRIERYRLLGYRCTSCGTIYFMRRRICPKCASKEIISIELPKNGYIDNYTIIRQAPDRFKKYEPYAVAIIDLNNVKVLAQVTDLSSTNENLDGIPVEAVFRILYEYGKSGHIVYGTKFRPVI